MSTFGGTVQGLQNSTPSYVPLGKPTAGLESPENKDQTLPPVEESSASEKNRNQPHQKADAATGDQQKRSGKDRQSGELSDSEKQQVRELAATDRTVRAHEAAHQAVGGSLTGAASFRFVTGPDGTRYAVGGDVPVLLTTVHDDPEASIRLAEQVRAAALAPAEPSNQDRAVAAAATQVIAEQQLQITLQRSAALHSETHKSPTAGRAAIDSFTAVAGQTLDPGLLLNKRS